MVNFLPMKSEDNSKLSGVQNGIANAAQRGAYSMNVQRSDWSLFQSNLIRYQNILKSYGTY